MAQRALSADALTCPICLETLKDPVTLTCGHSYCMDCIQTNWDQEVRYSCPQCREIFTPRPVLAKNTVLANLVEELKTTGLIAPPADHCYAGPGDVSCDHQGHHTVSSAAERAHRQKQLEAKRAVLQQNLLYKETEQERLRQEAQDISRSAQTAVQRSGDSFREMALLLEKRRSEVEQQIRSEEQIQLKQVQELQDQLQRDVTELKRSISELDTLSLTPDHNQFLLLCPSLSTDSEKTESRLQTRPRTDFEDVTRAVSALRDQLQLSLREFNMFGPEPRSREDFLRYASDVTLDPNTAYKQLSLSDGNRRATAMSKQQSYPDHPDRFVDQCQILSTEGLTGRCYWEVECSGEYVVYIAVSYRDIKRRGTGNECIFGHNDKSWALRCDKNSYSFYFNRVESQVSGPISGIIGVYLDHSAGALSFYSVKDKTMSLLHRVQTTFTQPLFAGVCCYYVGDTGKFLKLR
uniref:Tripartite motif-containing protein 16-like n=1 Tax=Neogobius melanostomus TaxID=47308 RepID=A0A8C6T4K6_9GOBI